MSTAPRYIIGSWAMFGPPVPCERCGKLAWTQGRVFLAPFNPQENRTPTYCWCIPCAAQMGAVHHSQLVQP